MLDAGREKIEANEIADTVRKNGAKTLFIVLGPYCELAKGKKNPTGNKFQTNSMRKSL